MATMRLMTALMVCTLVMGIARHATSTRVLPQQALQRATNPSLYGSANPLKEKETKNFLSATLGSNMVLQRAPQSAVIWGFVAPSETVTVSFNGASITATTDSDGTWRASLPPMKASSTPYTIQIKSSTGQTATMENVLFGDVYICGGQSNMQFAMPGIENMTYEVQLANKYPLIRLFTVGQKTSSVVPLDDLQTVSQTWGVANNITVAGGGTFGYMSAVCWIFGREIFDGLASTGVVPIGLISNNWGGTSVETWMPNNALDKCEPGKNDSRLYNAMIHPYTLGPMALTGFTWYQGEANARTVASSLQYTCTFPGMIAAWREVFNQPTAYFGFIQLSTWCGDPDAIAQMRQSQLSALTLPKVGFATNADHGAGCNIHPPPKQYCAKRLANSAFALAYGEDVMWKSPSFKSQTASASPPSVTINLQDASAAGIDGSVYPSNQVAGLNCSLENQKTPNTCVWAAVEMGPGNWVNATISVASNGQSVTFTAPASFVGQTPTASSYGWGAVPMLSLYDRQTGLPVIPWRENITTV